jgi:hypothetical protein
MMVKTPPMMANTRVRKCSSELRRSSMRTRMGDSS